MPDSTHFRDVMTTSAKLAQEDAQRALEIVDEAIAEAVLIRDDRWVRTLCHHAAIIARFTENLDLAKGYYERSLAVKPENARALYGLAFIAREQGHAEAAKAYAARCYQALNKTEEEFLKDELMELLLKNWPEVAQK